MQGNYIAAQLFGKSDWTEARRILSALDDFVSARLCGLELTQAAHSRGVGNLLGHPPPAYSSSRIADLHSRTVVGDVHVYLASTGDSGTLGDQLFAKLVVSVPQADTTLPADSGCFALIAFPSGVMSLDRLAAEIEPLWIAIRGVRGGLWNELSRFEDDRNELDHFVAAYNQSERLPRETLDGWPDDADRVFGPDPRIG